MQKRFSHQTQALVTDGCLKPSSSYLGAQFRRLRTKLGAPIAIKAMAAKLARLVYRMLRCGMRFVDQGAEFYEARHRQLQINHVKWKASFWRAHFDAEQLKSQAA